MNFAERVVSGNNYTLHMIHHTKSQGSHSVALNYNTYIIYRLLCIYFYVGMFFIMKTVTMATGTITGQNL